jgi:hypothetical protein
MLLLVPWTDDSPLPTQSAYVYVEDPDALCAEYRGASADIRRPGGLSPLWNAGLRRA